MSQHQGAEFAHKSPFATNGAVTTRFWWVRHAPVPDGGKIYGQRDLSCDCSDTAVFQALARTLPAGAHWITSPLKRAKETAAAIFSGGHVDADQIQPELVADFAEQSLGDWQGLDRVSFLAERSPSMIAPWFGPVDERAPNGESFMDLLTRTRRGVDECLARLAGRDVVVVAHGGTIRAAIGHALGLTPRDMLVFTTDNCALTRLDHISTPKEQGWRVICVNHQPWIGARGETKLA
jgi:alpha-ribazole phosphatase